MEGFLCVCVRNSWQTAIFLGMNLPHSETTVFLTVWICIHMLDKGRDFMMIYLFWEVWPISMHTVLKRER